MQIGADMAAGNRTRDHAMMGVKPHMNVSLKPKMITVFTQQRDERRPVNHIKMLLNPSGIQTFQELVKDVEQALKSAGGGLSLNGRIEKLVSVSGKEIRSISDLFHFSEDIIIAYAQRDVCAIGCSDRFDQAKIGLDQPHGEAVKKVPLHRQYSDRTNIQQELLSVKKLPDAGKAQIKFQHRAEAVEKTVQGQPELVTLSGRSDPINTDKPSDYNCDENLRSITLKFCDGVAISAGDTDASSCVVATSDDGKIQQPDCMPGNTAIMSSESVLCPAVVAESKLTADGGCEEQQQNLVQAADEQVKVATDEKQQIDQQGCKEIGTTDANVQSDDVCRQNTARILEGDYNEPLLNREESLGTTFASTSQFDHRRKILHSAAIMGRFNVGKTLGMGSFAVVKQCKSKKTGLDFAMKIVSRLKLNGREDLLSNEIRIMRHCKHPNVVKLYDIFNTDDNVYLIMELVKVGIIYH
jgi:Protein kinase domain